MLQSMSLIKVQSVGKISHVLISSHLYSHRKAVHKASSAGNLKRHKKNVHDGTKDECNICFKKLHNVAVHIKEVHEGCEYKCDQCPITFASTSGLRHHKKKIHVGIRFKCKDCDKSFINNKSLNNHVKLAHDDDGSR